MCHVTRDVDLLERRARLRERIAKATANAKKVLVKGDRIVVTKCPGTKRWILFDHWNGDEIISASGRGGYGLRPINLTSGVRSSKQVTDCSTLQPRAHESPRLPPTTYSSATVTRYGAALDR